MTDVVPMWLNAAALALALMCFASFTWAVLKLFRRSSSRTPAAMHALGLTGFAFFIAQMAALAIPSDDRENAIYCCGVLLYFAALALFWKSVTTIERKPFHIAFTDHQPQELIMTGPYKYIRHPFYASYLLFWIAGVLCSQHWWLLASVIVMGGFYFAAILHEEREFMDGEMSEAYRTYIRRTGSLMPKLYR